MHPTVTIITPYRNSERFLLRFVLSIRAQTRSDWLCIMVDDASTDNGPQYLEQLTANDTRFKLIRNTFQRSHPGPASARNCALSYVDTPLIAFCDVDDLWHPEKLERQLSYHLTNNLDLSVSAYGRFCNDLISQPLRSIVCPPAQLTHTTLRGPNPIPMLTVIMASHLVGVGFLQVAHEDFLFWLDLFRRNPSLRYGCLQQVLSFYCIHSDNLSASKSLMPIWTYRVFRQSGESRLLSLYFLFIWIRGHISNRLALFPYLNADNLLLADLLECTPLTVTQGQYGPMP